ncbi:trehalose monomycolate transport factor TtfA [Mycobacterium sp. NPDC050041]|uniref:trehalose monomycolate transport factor TtfA n=1 Tax=Mycobacterium sp. NPDC050041 TaxID=3364293 RepID=UPI003C2AC7E8
MVPLWFTLSALCFVGAAVLLYVDIDRRRGLGRRRKSWAKSHGFDYEHESGDILKRWKRGVMSTVGDVNARNVVLGQIRGEAVFIFDLEDVATVIALHRKVGTNVVVDVRLKDIKEPRENDIWLLGAIGPRMVYSTNLDAARRACDRRMVTFAHTAPDCAEIMWNEQNWTLVSMPVTSTRAQWDEGLRTVRQFNDLLRVLPPVPQPAASQPAPRRSGSPSRPLKPAPAPRAEMAAGRADAAPGRADVTRYPQRPEAARAEGPPAGRAGGPSPVRAEPSRRPPQARNARQSPHYQR